ncbi:MAG: tripartite tricarboxylate transporter TctB family protein [Spirochaetales bacterium]|nr:tripartite tricarboxylate transporter TctB family protein [Spirochaetales bacterium]
MDRKELGFTIVLLLIGAAGLVYSLTLPTMGPIALSPGLFPGVVTALTVILGVVRLIQLYRSRGAEVQREEEGKRSLLITLGLFLAYLGLLVIIGFIPSTLLFLCGSMLYLYRRFYWKIPLVALLTTFGTFFLFRYLLNVRLP